MFLQPIIFSSENNKKVIRSPSWPGLSPFFIYILLTIIALAIGFIEDVLSDIFFGYAAVAFLLISVVSLIQIWAFLTRSGFRRTLKSLPVLLSKNVFGGWIVLDLYFIGILLFVFMPIITIAILDIFFYPVIEAWSRSTGGTIELPWFIIHRICENRLQILAFSAIPFEIMFLLSAGRYLWQCDIGSKFHPSESSPDIASGGNREK
jgi:hypothetical protein